MAFTGDWNMTSRIFLRAALATAIALAISLTAFEQGYALSNRSKIEAAKTAGLREIVALR